MWPSWKTLWTRLKQLKAELPNDPAIQLLNVYPKELNDACTPVFVAALSNCPSTDE